MGVSMIIRALSFEVLHVCRSFSALFLILRGATALSFSALFDVKNIKCIISPSEDFSRESCTATRMSNGGNSSLAFF